MLFLAVGCLQLWCSWSNFFLFKKKLFPLGFPRKSVKQRGVGVRRGKSNKVSFQYIALRITEMFRRVWWDDLSFWWPCRACHNNCSLKPIGGGVKFSWKYFLLVSLDQIPTSSHLPSQISCDLWKSQVPRPTLLVLKACIIFYIYLFACHTCVWQCLCQHPKEALQCSGQINKSLRCNFARSGK